MSGRRRLLIVGFDRHPSLRLRVLEHVPRLQQAGYHTEVVALRQGRPQERIPELDAALGRSDIVLVQRVLEPKLTARFAASGLPVVFDVDDALHYVRPEAPGGRAQAARQLKRWYRTVTRGGPDVSSQARPLREILALAHTVVAGNDWLARQYAPYAREVVMIPTTVPVRPDLIRPPRAEPPIRIGWVGLKDNFRSLRILEPAFEQIADRFAGDVRLSVVSSEPYVTNSIPTEFVPWTLDGERASVAQFDIGVMPLESEPFAMGKCAFKAILCMAHGVPVVASPVGANRTVVDHARNGFLADGTQAWVDALTTLIASPETRRKLGSAALTTIGERFDIDAGFRRLLATLEKAEGA